MCVERNPEPGTSKRELGKDTNLEPGTSNVELQLYSRFQVPGSGFRGAKGETRTPIPFREPDPKSGASASSATFASGSGYHGNGATVRRCDCAAVRKSGATARGATVRPRVSRAAEGQPAREVRRRLPSRCAESIRVGTSARAARFTFEMMSSSTGPRDDARELMARRAGT